MLGSLIIFTIFILSERFSRNPFIDLSLFLERAYLAGALARIGFSFTFGSMMFFVGLYLQNILGYTAMQAGLILLSMTVLSALFSMLGGKIVDRFGGRKPLMLGLFFCAVSLLLLANLPVIPNNVEFVLPLAISGLGIAFVVVPSITIAMKSVPDKKRGGARGLFYTIGRAWPCIFKLINRLFELTLFNQRAL